MARWVLVANKGRGGADDVVFAVRKEGRSDGARARSDDLGQAAVTESIPQ
jgi:hypothetical protein